VICVGNITVGGAGKTPVAIHIAEYFIAQDYLVHFLTRGYGGREKGPLLVDPKIHTAVDVGDEPLLLARIAPTWVSADRVAGSAAAAKAGARLIIMDDGLQNPGLEKDFSLLVVDALAGIGNGRLLPAGPMREELNDALGRTNAVILVGRGHGGDGVAARAQARAIPVFRAILRATPTSPLDKVAVVGFSGIGRPEKFFQTLRDLRAEVIGTYPFPDHHNFTEADATKLLQAAEDAGARLITTEKDFMRLIDAVSDSARSRLKSASTVLPVRILIDGFDSLMALAQAAITNRVRNDE
jgi:tetraacyldisaccharide 4'-kinase